MIEGTKCVIRLGKPGCGKSLDQTEQEVLPHLEDGIDVYCCYWINWRGYEEKDGTIRQNFHYFPPTRRGWDSIKDKRNCVVVFDELAQIFDPRDWNEEGSEVRRWFQLHRHFHIDIYANTQDVSLVAKSVGIIADEWQLIEKIEEQWWKKWLLKKFNRDRIRIKKEYLTWQQLKKMANGWELGEDVAIDGDWEYKNYRISKLVHKELDEQKEELIHTYCEKCMSRQGERIDRTQTNNVAIYSLEQNQWELKEKKYCEKHREEELKVKESGLYDTDYTPETDEIEVQFKAFIPSPKGWRDIEYKGLLSKEQNTKKQNLVKKYKQTKLDNYISR